MIKDSRDATIEHLDLTIRCLVNDMMMLKQELDETKSERDAALDNAIRMKLNKLSSTIETFAMETEKSFKKEYIKGINTKNFVRNEHNEDLARSAILAYRKV